MKSSSPTKTEPIGAASPLLKQTETEEKSLAILETGWFKATPALNIRAPSKCDGILYSFTTFPN